VSHRLAHDFLRSSVDFRHLHKKSTRQRKLGTMSSQDQETTTQAEQQLRSISTAAHAAAGKEVHAAMRPHLDADRYNEKLGDMVAAVIADPTHTRPHVFDQMVEAALKRVQ
jgi:hypothetical protein